MRVERVDVGERRLEALLRFEAGEPLRTSLVPGLADRALALLPGLAGHSCENVSGLDFSAEMRDTEVAHFFEHVVCELMALAGSPRTLKGETSWDFARDGAGVFRVGIAFDDDLVALGAVKAGAALVRALVDGTGPPDVGVEVARLRRVREGPS